MINYAIEVNNVSKSFKNTLALKDVSLKIEKNKIYGLLGRNGAGKTTLINIITNKLFSDNGTVKIFNEPARENDAAQANIFCMPDTGCLPYDIKVKSVYKWLKHYYPCLNLEYTFKLAQKFNLDIEKRTKSLSTGYDTIFRLIPALATDTPIAIFDEPVLGLDANHRDLFYKELISVYANRPRTFIVSTHLIDEITDVLEDVIIIKQGKVVVAKPVEDFLSSAYTVSGLAVNVDRYTQGKIILHSQAIGSLKAVTLSESKKNADSKKIKELNLEMGNPRLQELFINLTN